MKVEITKDNISPFYLEVKGHLTQESKVAAFIDLCVAVKNKHPDYEHKKFYAYVGE